LSNRNHTKPTTPPPNNNTNTHQLTRYEIFTCFLGKGDKETFAYAMAAVKEPYYVISSPPASLGTTGE